MLFREEVMEIKSSNPKTPGNLYHAVGQDWKGMCTFVFLKSKENEARMVVDGIILFLNHGYGNKVKISLTQRWWLKKRI